MPDLHVVRKSMWQHYVSGTARDPEGSDFISQLPLMFRFHERLTNYQVETVIVTQGIPNWVNQAFLGIFAYKLKLAAKGAALSNVGELLQHCIFELIEPVKFLQFYRELHLFSSKGDQDEMYD